MGLLKRWGLGVELLFDANRATVGMKRVRKQIVQMKLGLKQIGEASDRAARGLGMIGSIIAPIGAAFGLFAVHSSSLASDLEAQTLTMRVLLGSAEKASLLISKIREEAASTPFAEGDLIEGSKRLLRLSGKSVDKNMELLKLMETMTALDPTKTVTDSVEALLDAASGGGFERLNEFGISFRAEDFAAAGRPGGKAWGVAVVKALQETIDERVGGEDLVGALSRTFGGRISTLKDSMTNIMREVGAVINDEIGPMLEPATEFLKSLAGPAKDGALLVADAFRLMVTKSQPYIDQALGWWEALGGESKAQVFAMVLGIGALSAVLTVLGGTAAALGILAGGVVTLVSALAPLMSGPALAVLLAVGTALGAAAVAGGLFFAMFRERGEAPLDFLIRLGTAARVGVVNGINQMRTAATAFVTGFVSQFGGVQGVLEPLRMLGFEVANAFLWAIDVLNGRGVDVDLWTQFGLMAGAAVNLVLGFVQLLVEGYLGWIDVFRFGWAFMEARATRGAAFFGGLFREQIEPRMQRLQDLAVKIGDTFANWGARARAGAAPLVEVVRFVGGMIATLVGALFGLMIKSVQAAQEAAMSLIRQIPGADLLLKGRGLAEGFGGDFLRNLDADIATAIGAVDTAAKARAGEAAAAAAPTVNVAAPPVDVAVDVTTCVEIDKEEVARAVGAQKVASSRRQGRPMPSAQRGRVLRGGSTVTALEAEEVL